MSFHLLKTYIKNPEIEKELFDIFPPHLLRNGYAVVMRACICARRGEGCQFAMDAKLR
jgi:hypothetical protein